MFNKGNRGSDGGGTTAGAREHGAAPGKRTLTQAIQRRAKPGPAGAPSPGNHQPGLDAGAAVQAKGDVDPGAVHSAAAAGIGGSDGDMPYLDAIQKAFGPHDVGDIRAHTDGTAAAACDAMGATAYATGNRVAFRETPDLHTTAHEAAHVVQQRAGVSLASGVGASGDSYERAADAVADRVVAGQSAEDLLAPSASRTTSSSPSSAATQMNEDDRPPPGRGLCTEFGDYWIVPDSTTVCYANIQGEQITESAFRALQADWDKVKDGSGRIQITETDSSGVQHGGFEASILQKIGLLMSAPTGRRLVQDLVNGSHAVTIRPSAAPIYGGANAIRGSASTLEGPDGTSGGGGTTIIQIDPSCSDTDIKVYDASGNEIADPVFIFLGHEMIHARHNQEGHNRRNLPATDASYSNREEQETVEGAGISENALRSEHGLPARHGSGGRDVR
jgi:hypothetical protein